MELADTSAWTTRHRDPQVEEDFNDLVEDGEIAICEVVELELLWSARDAVDFVERRAALESLPEVSIDRAVWRRAIDVFQLLAERGPLHHREVKIPDLLVAAAAELTGIPVVHYDRDFETIAAVTGQPVRSVAALGSL
ncbi:MAG TPA: PIN domain nuclease [Gaiellaceae bacterium]|jgi:hypothetical protein|nr:PIN domain nuclease [Gaiellaceae bacterium]